MQRQDCSRALPGNIITNEKPSKITVSLLPKHVHVTIQASESQIFTQAGSVPGTSLSFQNTFASSTEFSQIAEL